VELRAGRAEIQRAGAGALGAGAHAGDQLVAKRISASPSRF
jgi:hypothetical protein